MHPALRLGILAVAVLTAAGCAVTEEEGDPHGPMRHRSVVHDLAELVRSLVGTDEIVVRVYDWDGTRAALGVEPAGTVDAEPGGRLIATGRTQPHLLLVLDGATRQARRPLGAARVLDAAVGSRASDVAYIDEEGLLCLVLERGTSWCTSLPAEPVGMDVAPDGRVVFVARSNGGTDIWSFDPLTGGAPLVLTTGVGFRNRPLFDPEGRRVVYVGTSPSGLASLFVVDAGGGEPRQLTNVGLTPGPPGRAGRLPPGFVPPPLIRGEMRWDASGIRYRTYRSAWRVDPATGDTVEERLQ